MSSAIPPNIDRPVEAVPGGSLIDAFLPSFDVVERHRIHVRAPACETYRAITTADLASHGVVRFLFAIRGIPIAVKHLLRGTRTPPPVRGARLRDFERNGFAILAEDPPRELLIGLEGRFWRPDGDLIPVSASHFRSPLSPGLARAAWNFRVEPVGPDRCVLSTETRVLCADAGTRRRFLSYWMLVRPGSGLIRHLMLRSIRREAENAGNPADAPIDGHRRSDEGAGDPHSASVREAPNRS